MILVAKSLVGEAYAEESTYFVFYTGTIFYGAFKIFSDLLCFTVFKDFLEII